MSNKRDLRAGGLPLQSPALRPRLLSDQSKIVALSTILPIFGIFCGLILNSAIATPVSAASLSLTFPSEPITLDLDSSMGEAFKESTLATFSASASDVDFGYTLSIAAQDSNTLKNGASAINPIAGTLAPDVFATQAGLNTWGYLPNKLNSLDNTEYQPGPTKEGSVIEKTKVGDGVANPYSLKIAAKIDSSLPTGRYANTFILTLVANKVSYSITYNLNSGTWTGTSSEIGESTESTTTISSITPTRNGYEFLGWCTNATTNETCSGDTIQPGKTVDLVDGENNIQLYAMWKSAQPTTMQDFGNQCSSMTEKDTLKLTDARDGKKYTITKLKDGKCWMTENLRITGSSSFQPGHTETLTSDDSDLPSGKTFELPANGISKFNTSGGYTSDSAKDNKAAYYGSNTTYGAYYTWYTATAGTGDHTLTTANQNATGSICPKGWRLPTGGSGGDFQTLTNAYSIGNNTAGSNTLRGEPLNFTYAGGVGYNNGVLNGLGDNGVCWSSTVSNQYGAYNLRFLSSNVNPTNSSNRPYGYSVRCVAREPKSMQKVSEWYDEVKTGENIEAKDERDGSIYTVSKLDDGNVWMTQNLRIGSNEQETVLKSDTSDVASDFDLPVGTTKTASSKTDTTGWHYQQYNTSHIYINSNTNYGGYYTWFAATAGEGTQSKSSGDTSHSICPKGWRLPTSAEIKTLTGKYDTTTRNDNPPNFGSTVWAGYCDEVGCPRDSGSYGSWWSSTAVDSTYAHFLGSNSSVFYLSGNYKGYGRSVRCVARGA